MDVFRKHQLRIARDTLRLSDVGARVMGGPSKEEARAFLRQAGWTDAEIRAWEDSPTRPTEPVRS